MKGLFITFEGGEGSGKTTIINKIKQYLINLGYEVVQTREPGGSKIAEQIRQVILDKENTEMEYMTEALLYAASRHQHLKEIIVPALNEGKVVLCDRYLDSSLAYQGYARGLGIEKVYEINKYAIDNVMPNRTIYFDLEPSIGLGRIKSNNRGENRLDVEKMEFHTLVREGYITLSHMFENRFRVVDASKTIDEVYESVLKVVLESINE